jgi:hypothetical protein
MAALLRGHKGFYVKQAGLWKHVAKGGIGEVPLGPSKSTLLTEEACKKLPHLTLCILGKFKRETGTNHSPGQQDCVWAQALMVDQEVNISVLVGRKRTRTCLCHARQESGTVGGLQHYVPKVPGLIPRGHQFGTGGSGCGVAIFNQ